MTHRSPKERFEIQRLRERRVQGGIEAGQVERLGKVGPDSPLSEAKALVRRGLSTHGHDDRHGSECPRRAQHIERVSIRQVDIQQQQLRLELRE
ncbi:MAG TPA: hypothetical protein VD972_11385 [Hyalangium sp.]|nr:hypothetical protein [Hyalangium sp.]HYH96567.1 hypothetical protein [Hyalangium sp.]